MQIVDNWPQIDPEGVWEWLRERVQATKLQATDSLVGLWDQYGVDEDIGTFANYAATCSLAAQSVIWTVTHSALQMYADLVSDIALNDLEPIAMPHGGCREASPFAEYRWPQARFIKVLRQSNSIDEATRQARGVIRQLADTDIQLAYVNASLIYFHLDPRIGSYERVVAGTCDFCLKHQGEYKLGITMPLHPNCKCAPKPKVNKKKVKPSKVIVKTLAGKVIPKEVTSEIEKTVAYMKQQAQTIANTTRVAGESRHRILLKDLKESFGLWVYQSNGYHIMQTYLRNGVRATYLKLLREPHLWEFGRQGEPIVIGNTVEDVKKVIDSMDAMMAPLSKDLVVQRCINGRAVLNLLQIREEDMWWTWRAGKVLPETNWIVTDAGYNSTSLDPTWFEQRMAGRFGSRGGPIDTSWAVTIRVPKGTLATRLPLGPGTPEPWSPDRPYGAYYVPGEDELVLHRGMRYHVISVDYGRCEIVLEALN